MRCDCSLSGKVENLSPIRWKVISALALGVLLGIYLGEWLR